MAHGAFQNETEVTRRDEWRVMHITTVYTCESEKEFGVAVDRIVAEEWKTRTVTVFVEEDEGCEED